MLITSPTYQLSDEKWAQISDPLPGNGQRGGRRNDHRRTIDAILRALSAGGRWRNKSEAFCPRQMVYDHFRSWKRLRYQPLRADGVHGK
jgi:transposase